MGSVTMNIFDFKTAAAVATFVAATVVTTTASANPFDFFTANREGVQAPAYANPNEDQSEVRADLRRQIVSYPSNEAPGTIIVDTPHTYLYFVLGGGKALRYGIGVGREGFTWSGVETISRMAEWPDWNPPREMIGRQPYLPRFVAGGPGNPLGARALYLGHSQYRIHGTNDPTTIGHQVSSGRIRLTNEDVADLYGRVTVGTKVVVLPQASRRAATARPSPAVSTASARSDAGFAFGIH